MSGTLLVTGGGRGIGAAVARLGAAAGYVVCVNYRRDAEAAEAVVAAIERAGGRALAVQADVAREAEVERLFQTVDTKLPPLRALVNNAGTTGLAGRLEEASARTIRDVMEINVLGLIWCCQAAVRRLAERHGGTGGSIVNISSGAATLGSADTFVWYAASKGAVDSLTLGLALENARDGLRVNAVAPGLIRTNLHADSGMPDRLETMPPQTPMGRPGDPEEIAEAVIWLLSDKASFTNGAVLRVTGGR
ncbi:MAG: SDR family oxidoreductase [Kiloniellaceae bacterium]